MKSSGTTGMVKIGGGLEQRLAVPEHLNAREAGLFETIVNAHEPAFFVPGDIHAIQLFIETLIIKEDSAEHIREHGLNLTDKNQKLYSNPSLKTFDSASDKLISLFLNLRICPSARTDPRTVKGQAETISDTPLGRLMTK